MNNNWRKFPATLRHRIDVCWNGGICVDDEVTEDVDETDLKEELSMCLVFDDRIHNLKPGHNVSDNVW